MSIWFWIILAAVILLGVLPLFFLPGVLYSVLLVRIPKSKWKRECSMPDDEEIVRMFDTGMAWAAENSEYKHEVETSNKKIKLCGEYFDFGYDRAAIILAGRTETCLYGYYFAKPYKEMGYNILVVDNRAHGLSGGTFATLGKKESEDLLCWGKYINEKFGVKSIVVHGICIGSAAALYAMISKDCPEYFTGMVAEGMFIHFYDSFKNHMKEMGHRNFPMTYIVMAYIRVCAGVNVVTDGPIYRIDKMEKPILMMQSMEDKFSLPHYAEVLYNKCSSKNKKLVYFDKGAHSHIRINAEEKYDETIKEFLNTI